MLADLHLALALRDFAGVVLVLLSYFALKGFLTGLCGVPSDAIGTILVLHLMVGALALDGASLNALSGRFIKSKTRRGFSQLVAGLNCLQFPFGTVLGIYALWTLRELPVRQAR